jgi:hypothetical protein
LEDLSYALKSTATMTVDNTGLPLQSTYVGYFSSLPGTWTGGSSHSVSVQTAAGGSFTTTVIVPAGTLTGVTYSPVKTAALAATYTVSPPTGGWPTGSFVVCTYTKNGASYALNYRPTGSSPLSVPGALYSTTDLTGATAVSFQVCLRNTYPVTGFGPGSAITVSGVPTSW